MLKKLILILCVISVILLAACKQEPVKNGENSQTAGSSEKADTNYGTELEEDVFDYGSAQSGASQGSSKDNAASTDSKQEVTDGSGSADTSADTSTDTSSPSSSSDSATEPPEQSDTPSDTPSDSSSSELNGATVEDGVIKLPIDKFD